MFSPVEVHSTIFLVLIGAKWILRFVSFHHTDIVSSSLNEDFCACVLPPKHSLEQVGYNVFSIDNPYLVRENKIRIGRICSVTDPGRSKIYHRTLKPIFNQLHSSNLCNRSSKTVPRSPDLVFWELTLQLFNLLMHIIINLFTLILVPSVYFRVDFGTLRICNQAHFNAFPQVPRFIFKETAEDNINGLLRWQMPYKALYFTLWITEEHFGHNEAFRVFVRKFVILISVLAHISDWTELISYSCMLLFFYGKVVVGRYNIVNCFFNFFCHFFLREPWVCSNLGYDLFTL